MTKKHFSFRSGTIEDLDQLHELANTAYGQFEKVLSADNWQIFKGNLQDEQKFADMINIARSFVCLDGEKIVAAAYLIPSGNPTRLFKTEWSYIRMVGVHPDYRGQGLAKILTSMCIEVARQNREKTIALHTSEFMDAARHIYESLGFRIFEEIPLLYGKRYWLYTLELE